ncbi:hypothetical protein [Streptococcus sp. E17BB]|uniref:hypothetical protein n=1 Tax=Streptococcus sp. E17BB TaxID=3278714 RepID=UPI00359D3761
MPLLSSLKKLFSKTSTIPEPPTRDQIKIYGKEIDDPDFYEHVYPWAKQQIAEPNIVISDLILLWVIKRLGLFTEKYPVHLSRNYGVTDYGVATLRLINLGLLEQDGLLTPKGKELINNNQHYIKLHKSGWVTDEDKAANRASYEAFRTKHADYLDQIGLKDSAKELREQIAFDKLRDEGWKLFEKGERLSKQKQYQQSNELLLPLIGQKGVDFTAPLYERIAINYRGLKDYQAEIAICENFLKYEQPKYGGDMWIDTFKKRIAFSGKKLIQNKG